MEFSINAMEMNFLTQSKCLSSYREKYLQGGGSIHTQIKKLKQEIIDTYDEEENEILV